MASDQIKCPEQKVAVIHAICGNGCSYPYCIGCHAPQTAARVMKVLKKISARIPSTPNP